MSAVCRLSAVCCLLTAVCCLLTADCCYFLHTWHAAAIGSMPSPSATIGGGGGRWEVQAESEPRGETARASLSHRREGARSLSVAVSRAGRPDWAAAGDGGGGGGEGGGETGLPRGGHRRLPMPMERATVGGRRGSVREEGAMARWEG